MGPVDGGAEAGVAPDFAAVAGCGELAVAGGFAAVDNLKVVDRVEAGGGRGDEVDAGGLGGLGD